jgi:hypothetical protein
MEKNYYFIGTYTKDETFGEFYSEGRVFLITKNKDFVKSTEYALVDATDVKRKYVACLHKYDKKQSSGGSLISFDNHKPLKTLFFWFEYQGKKYSVEHNEKKVKIFPLN